MSECLTDNQVAAFVDGELANDTETFSHLNSCVKCFEQVTTVMNFVAENSELCEEINHSYDKMVSENRVGHYVRRFKKYTSDSFKNILPSSLEELFPAPVFSFNRYSVIGTAFLVGIIAINVQSSFIAENDISGGRLINASQLDQLESDLKEKESDYSEAQQSKPEINDYESDPDKKNAVELGKIVMKMKAASLFEEKGKLSLYLQELISNPLVTKNDAQSLEEMGEINYEDVNKIIDLYLKDIDMNLKPYFDYGFEVEKSKFQSQNTISN